MAIIICTIRELLRGCVGGVNGGGRMSTLGQGVCKCCDGCSLERHAMVKAEGRASGQRRRVRLHCSAPQLGQGLVSRISRALLRRDLEGAGGGGLYCYGVSRVLMGANRGQSDIHIDGARSSKKRPWRKARILASSASPGMSRGAPTRRPPMGFLMEEELQLGGLGGGLFVMLNGGV